ncbi:DUF503 domain-containing protein [Halalkalibacter sp. APA_J-10(15)]|uniref:DUF503 domain-containing protein n=1 Tax=unclassified Halalkalibacter TaxID=2893063 RepID=UPI001FF4AF32|nr:DUF503 domain-containing protein [Halalkalibacter sp. APA_J-10(15)]MCK0470795.1 DUF503 domain-containing protein [Halalkalibacter sp. APA_J-10(15)]
MVIGSVRLELLIYDVQSLKEKRSIIKSVQSKLKQKYNLSVAEVGHHDVWQRAELGIVTVSMNKKVCERELQRALALIDSIPAIERTVMTFEWL